MRLRPRLTWPWEMLDRLARATGLDGVLRMDEVHHRDGLVYAVTITRRVHGSYAIVKSLIGHFGELELTVRTVVGRPRHCSCKVRHRRPTLQRGGMVEIHTDQRCAIHGENAEPWNVS